MDTWLMLEILLVVLFAYLFGRSSGWRAALKWVARTRAPHIAAYSHALNAANYWEDRARLQEQKLEMLLVKSTGFVSVASLPKWRAEATKIMQATGEIARG